MIHQRSESPGDIPTIPSNNDHTTGWKNTDIYIGEIFMNTSVSTPGIWFRTVSGVTQLATLDNITNQLPFAQLTHNVTTITNNFTSVTGNTEIVTTGTQYLIINDSSTTITAADTIQLDNLEITGNTIYISLNIIVHAGGTLTTYLKSSSGNTIISKVGTVGTSLTGICLMYNGNKWVIISETTN